MRSPSLAAVLGLRAALVSLWLLAVLAPPALAQRAADPILVGIAERPPFAIRTSDGAWSGIGVDLWRQMAERLGLAYEWRVLEPGTLVDAVAAGTVDLALPADATPEAEARIDFLHPFYTATLGVAGERAIQLWSIAQNFLTWRFARVVLGIAALLLFVGAIMWLIERRANKDQFDGGTLAGLGNGFWWAGVTMTTIGYGDKAPVTFLGRAVAMVWMLIAMGLTASLTAAIIAAVGFGQDAAISVPADLRGERVGAVPETTSAAVLHSADIDFVPVEAPLVGLRAVSQERLGVFVHSAPVLNYLDAAHDEIDVVISATSLDPHLVSIAVPDGAALREPLNRALLELVTGEGWNALVRRYLPEQG